MPGSWTKWLQDYEATGELEATAYEEFLRYAAAIARNVGEPSRYRAKGASYVASGAVASALECVGDGNVDLTNRRHFGRLLGKIVQRKVSNIKRKRGNEKIYLEQAREHARTTQGENLALEDAVVKDLAEQFQSCVFGQASDPIQEDMFRLGILEGWSAGEVQREIASKYGEANVPAVRTIQVRLHNVKETCFSVLRERVAEESDGDRG